MRPVSSRILQHERLHKLPGLLVMLALFLLCCFIYKDYGAGWDEVVQRTIGVVNQQVIRSGNDSGMIHFANRDHGAAFELPLLWMEKVIPPATFGDMIALRHGCSFLYYLAGIWSGYLLALRLFGKQWIALLGVAMLVLQPRIFAHAFFNSKDVPFLAAMLIALNAISMAFERQRIYLFALAGAACGFAAGIRTLGLMLVMLTSLLLLRDFFMARGEARKQVLWAMLAFGFSALAMLYISWPALWHHPLRSLAYALFRHSRYVAWNCDVLFNGHTYLSSELPWYYAPEWFGISTPVGWLVAGIAGMLIGGRRVLRRPLRLAGSLKAKMLLLCAACFALPLLAVIGLKSILYDDWRHLYFIYPPFVMMALYAVEKIAGDRRGKIFVAACCGVQAIAAAAFMISAHPLQQVYFNEWTPHSPGYLRQHFDYDYWGVSYRQGLEYLLAHDRRDTMVIVNSDSPLEDNGSMLPAAAQGRIRWTKRHEDGAYFLTTHRYHPDDYGPPYYKVWGRPIGGSTAIQIYRIDSMQRNR